MIFSLILKYKIHHSIYVKKSADLLYFSRIFFHFSKFDICKVSVIWCRLYFIEGRCTWYSMMETIFEYLLFKVQNLKEGIGLIMRDNLMWKFIRKITGRSEDSIELKDLESRQGRLSPSLGRRAPQEHCQANDLPGVQWLILSHWEQTNW